MAARVRVSISNAPRCLAVGRQYSVSSQDASNSRGRPTTRPRQTEGYGHPSTSSDPKPSPANPSTSDSSASKIFKRSGPVILARRPSVKPPPTLALPPSMSPPAPHPPLPGAHRKQSKAQQEASGSQDNAFDIYLKSLKGTTSEPAIEELDALRPPAPTIRAALSGVLGTGRTLLPEGHSLHLAMEQLGAQEVTVGGGPTAKQKVTAGSRKAKKMEYTALYEATEGLISRRFNLSQLRKFEKDSAKGKGGFARNAPGSKGFSKQKVIHRIMNLRWSMIHPSVIKKQLEEVREIVEETYPISPSELFILLGRDGEDLLNVAEQFRLRISVDRETPSKSENDTSSPSGTFIIRASGVRQDQKLLKQHLEAQKKAVAIRMVVLPTGPPLSPPVLQSISRVSGAFVENVHPKLEENEGSTPSALITGRDPRSAYTAERLVQRAALEGAHRSRLPLISLTRPVQITSPESQDAQSSDEASLGYALYPYDTQGFRLQRIKLMSQMSDHTPEDGLVHWQYKTDRDTEFASDEDVILGTGAYSRDNIHDLGRNEIEDSKGPLQHWVIEDETSSKDVIATAVGGNVVDIYDILFGEAGDASSGVGRTLTATFGHVIFKTPGPSALISSLQGPAPIESALKWAEDQGSGARSFAPGLVPPLARSTLSAMTPTHRLQYRTVDGRNVVNVNVELPDESSAEPAQDERPLAARSSDDRNQADLDELSLGPVQGQIDLRSEGSDPAPEQEPRVYASESPSSEADASSMETAQAVEAADSIPKESRLLPSEVAIGTETTLELMLPDSTMDMTLRVTDLVPLTSETPEVLRKYLEDLSTFFTTDVDMFQPDPPQSFSIDEKYYVLYKNTSGRHGVETIHTDIDSLGCTVITENALDLENNTRSWFTQVTNNRAEDKEDWERFIRLCRKLAAQTYVRPKQARVAVP
ncbi:hypothetical protein BDV93DRAFT_226875 [Ceratobasidium sp. AG-I]|nr:hypothetical protein BDV93DRAFT_226875 [Ceratobasidium sp. AG-I]